MPHEFHGANGEIDLFRDWHETSSGHSETTTTAHLNSDAGGQVVLTLTVVESRVLRPPDDVLTLKYSICPQKLTKLIEEHGMKLS